MVPFLDAALKIAEKLIPDPQAKREAQLKIIELQQAGEFKELEANLSIALAQNETNKVEAADPSLFKSGWRPAVGWVCVLGLLYTFIGRPLLTWASVTNGHGELPALDMTDLMTLLAGMLGLGGMRTFEKHQGVA